MMDLDRRLFLKFALAMAGAAKMAPVTASAAAAEIIDVPRSEIVRHLDQLRFDAMPVWPSSFEDVVKQSVATFEHIPNPETIMLRALVNKSASISWLTCSRRKELSFILTIENTLVTYGDTVVCELDTTNSLVTL